MELQTTAKKTRIEWLDIAKGIVILTVIIGHTAEYGGTLRNFIFSFHMPLFFILSGYTYKIPKSLSDLKTQLKKDLKRLYFPCFLVAWLYEVCVAIANGTALNWLIVLKRLLWGNDNYTWGDLFFPGIGAVWFLSALFLAKLLYGFLQLKGKDHEHIGFYLVLAYIGILIGRKIWLPQSLDIILIAVLFLHIGHLWKTKEALIQKYLILLSSISAVVWLWPLEKGIYIELAARQYPFGLICVLEAICATFLIVQVTKMLEKFRIIKTVFIFLGQHTLEILCIHCLDSIFFTWDANDFVLRILLNILILIIYLLIKRNIYKLIHRCCRRQ